MSCHECIYFAESDNGPTLCALGYRLHENCTGYTPQAYIPETEAESPIASLIACLPNIVTRLAELYEIQQEVLLEPFVNIKLPPTRTWTDICRKKLPVKPQCSDKDMLLTNMNSLLEYLISLDAYQGNELISQTSFVDIFSQNPILESLHDTLIQFLKVIIIPLLNNCKTT